jgi:hypothetical protein
MRRLIGAILLLAAAACPAAADAPVEINVAAVGIPYGAEEPVAYAVSILVRNTGAATLHDVTMAVRLWGHGADWFDRYGANDCKHSTSLCAMTCEVTLVTDIAGATWHWRTPAPSHPEGPIAISADALGPRELLSLLIFTGGADGRARVTISAGKGGPMLDQTVEIRALDHRRKVTELDYGEVVKRCVARKR